MKSNRIYQPILIAFILLSSSISAQGLLDKLSKEFPDKPVYEIATFKTTRVGLGQSIETRKKGALEISIYNRYWNLPNFEGQRFLADKVSSRYGLNYSITDNFTLGFGYTNFDKISEAFVKYKLLKQRKKWAKMPVTVTLFQGASYRSVKNRDPWLSDDGIIANNNYAFTSQVLIARKINTELSLQVTPTLITRINNTAEANDPNTQFALAFAGRHKISNHAALVTEYYHITNPLKSVKTFNNFLVGINWEMSHLLLQFHMTNARNFAEDTFITQTTNNFNAKDGNFHFGFNATWVLQTKKRKLK